MIRLILFGAALAVMAAPASAAPVVLDTPVKDDWWLGARAALLERLTPITRPKRARNVILMIGDGMGISTITAARIFDGQRPVKGSPGAGEDNRLGFERMPHTALVKTYNSNAQVPDSAGTASAMNTGVKTRIGVINFGADQDAGACRTPAALPTTFAETAKRAGMAVGVVTTTRITHATPAAVYAHVPNRNWEAADRAYPAADRASGCPDIARQMLDFMPKVGGLDVMLGGGRSRFLPSGRDDGADLIAAWRRRDGSRRYVDDAALFRRLAPSGGGAVLGLFSDDHLSFEADRNPEREPSLAEMSGFAIAKLRRAGGRRGYYLMIEGGRIDHAHHGANPYRALADTQAFSEAVKTVLASVDLNETLVLVTADHSHVLTMAGYPERGNDILGHIKPTQLGESRGRLSPEGWALDNQGRPMTTLSYANGPRRMPGLSAGLPPQDKNRLADALYDTDAETHGGEDVALFADGPRADLARGVIEQHVIFHIMAEALGWR